MRYQDSTHDWIYITTEEAQKVIANLRPAHWQLPVKILYHYGLRASELLGLTSLNIKNGALVIQRLKGSRMTRQYLVPEIRKELEQLCASKIPGSRLFPYHRFSLWRVIQQAGNRAGVDPLKCHPHAFRHRAGRKWARQGTIFEVAAMMGHANIATTMKYARLECDEDLSRKFLE
jgi:integrase/recombinase XerD